MAGEERGTYFPEPRVPDLSWGHYQDSGRELDWLDRSTLPQAVRIREFLNRSLRAMPANAAANLAHRFREDPPFAAVFFELIVGRFLQVLGATVEHQPVGLGGRKTVDWRATFPAGVVYVEATSPAYNQSAALERRRREALVAVIDRESPEGWWVAPRRLPDLPLGASRREFRTVVRSLFANLPEPSGYAIDNRLRLEAPTEHGPLVLELWPGNPKQSPIAFVARNVFTTRLWAGAFRAVTSAVLIGAASSGNLDWMRARPSKNGWNGPGESGSSACSVLNLKNASGPSRV